MAKSGPGIVEEGLRGANHDVEAAPARSVEIVDVWSRTSPKYRIRAIVLLAVNVVLFAGVGCFAFWLRSGEVVAPAFGGYWDELAHTFKFGEQTEVSLAAFLMEPISAQDVPMQIPIVGLLMAALISIPILVAILYRFWTSLPFTAVVGFLAVMPWLAITLVGSCVIASVRPFRSRFRFMSALLALLPTVLYLILAWHGSDEEVAGTIDPIDRIKFLAPWVLAVVAAAVVFAIVLSIAKVVDYRPGAITPLLVLMFGLPVALFEYRVGRDELHYRLLEALSEDHFADVDASLDLKQKVRRAWERRPLAHRRWEEVYEIEEQKWQFELAADIGPYESELVRHQAEVTQRCDWFRKRFPDSRYALNALFVKARAFDMRVDPSEFRRTKWIRFYCDFPNAASKETWRMIAQNGSHTVFEAVALVRLAQLDARGGDVNRAIRKLERVLAEFDHQDEVADAGHPPGEAEGKGVLDRATPEASVNIGFDRIMLEAHRLHDLFVANQDPIYGYDPFYRTRRQSAGIWFGLMDLVPQSEGFISNLTLLKAAYPDCQLEENIDLEIAKATSSLTLKIERLEACLQRFPRRDAVPEALFRLGMAYKAAGESAKSQSMLARLVGAYPDSVWARPALHHAAALFSVHFSDAHQ